MAPTHTRSQTLTQIIEICADWGIQLNIYYDPSLNSKPYSTDGGFGVNPQLGADIEIDFAAHATPAQIWWCFLHEFGHCLQWLESHDDTTWLMGYLFSEHSKQELEIDAWVKAEALARNSLFPPTAGFYYDRRIALGTYGIDADAVDFAYLSCKPTAYL